MYLASWGMAICVFITSIPHLARQYSCEMELNLVNRGAESILLTQLAIADKMNGEISTFFLVVLCFVSNLVVL